MNVGPPSVLTRQAGKKYRTAKEERGAFLRHTRRRRARRPTLALFLLPPLFLPWESSEREVREGEREKAGEKEAQRTRVFFVLARRHCRRNVGLNFFG